MLARAEIAASGVIWPCDTSCKYPQSTLLGDELSCARGLFSACVANTIWLFSSRAPENGLDIKIHAKESIKNRRVLGLLCCRARSPGRKAAQSALNVLLLFLSPTKKPRPPPEQASGKSRSASIA